MKTVIEMAREAGWKDLRDYDSQMQHDFFMGNTDSLKCLVDLARAAEREAISDEWSMCVQSDLEHGVKSLNEQAAKEWFKNYREISKFGAWLEARGNT